jgi:hypothetical protein
MASVIHFILMENATVITRRRIVHTQSRIRRRMIKYEEGKFVYRKVSAFA